MHQKKGNKVEIDRQDLENVVRYALVQCREMCPEGRDPEACVSLVLLTKELGVEPPPCVKDYGGFSIDVFQKLIREIERKRGMRVEEIFERFRKFGIRCLEDSSDYLELTFAIGVIRALKRRGIRAIY